MLCGVVGKHNQGKWKQENPEDMVIRTFHEMKFLISSYTY